jgi:transposase
MTHRKYDKEFKFNAINLYRNGKLASAVCRDLGIPDATFHYWIKQYREEREEGFRGSGKPKASNDELAQLKKELENTKLERDILKKAVAIFSKQK